MMIWRKLLVFFIGILLAPFFGKAQLSEGGKPLKINKSKSARFEIIEMPILTDQQIENEKLLSSQDNKLKPFRFAHPFDVNITTLNSGDWFEAEDGTDVWQLTIRSENALSINLIFDDFELPKGSRLFIFSEEEGHILGAFTNNNNASYRQFAVSPVLGDEITIQYELKNANRFESPFRIVRVNHDFIGILKAGSRRPLGKTAGTCNIDINCDSWAEWTEVKNSVCRLIVNGVEVCSGTLVNNTAENQKPYVLSAGHCYDYWDLAKLTVYTFNYESPFCAPLDGDPANSLTGAVMKAQFDSLDFALVQLNSLPPPTYRPYYAGWNRSGTMPQKTVSIHHPQGDVKKISNDNNSPTIASFGTSYTKNGFQKITRWEGGVTEAGSSGGPLFDNNKLLIGTLTGGEATCASPINDYYNRFSLAWEYKKDSAKQLKCWLDPKNSGVQSLNGKQFNSGTSLCGVYENLTDADKYGLVAVANGTFSGYWGGSNKVGITEILEKFYIPGNEEIQGVSLGVAKFKSQVKNDNSEITIKVYNGTNLPEKLIYSQVVKTSPLAQDAMNYIKFNQVVKPTDNFFVGFELSNIQPLDSFAVYQSTRLTTAINTYYLKQNGVWYNFKDKNAGKYLANIIELVACNINDFSNDTPKIDNPLEINIFPNPTDGKLNIETGQDFSSGQITGYNILGKEIRYSYVQLDTRRAEIDLTGNLPGIYFVRYYNEKTYISKKISFVP